MVNDSALMERHKERSQKLAPCEVFTVPDGVRHLEPAQLVALERSFKLWCAAAKRSDRRRSRERMRLLFLMLRYSGARLGEVQALDDRCDLDLESGEAVFGENGARRTVPLPVTLCRELDRFLDGPLGAGLEGTLFQVDPGYVRRIFYARAAEAGCSKTLAAPRGLRASRAVELLRSGVPLTVVRDILGQSSTDLTCVFQAYSQEDAQRIVRRLAPDDAALRTSARNTFLCRVLKVRCDGVMAEVILKTDFGTELCSLITQESAMNLGLEPGAPVAATVKAPLVDLGQAGATTDLDRNRIPAVITGIKRTAVIGEIIGEAADGTSLCALVSGATLDQLDPVIGQLMEFRFKALVVVLNSL
ncbi:TOBE domain-containing protein [Desulfovibrio ferrophilus]|uniref:TOBE domain protein n=1 Tax=Desulfovibrio ferrophilus TaxID=241368 RepID=A0A2Z6AY86_9BACT|nr:TOBE domain-containing protein [Desulfovibrio ferrophilus]BBD08221.1 TOBE domain protein [Desulfovibrio ferrophilus]